MMRLRWTLAAVHDLETIVGHIQKDNPEVARKVAESTFDSLQKLLAFPGMGRPGKKSGTREYVLPPYVIVYRIVAEFIELLRIWHGAQQRD